MDDFGDLWQDYQADRSDQNRNRLVEAYLPQVEALVVRLKQKTFAAAPVDVGDLLQYGILGLIDAVERFDPARKLKFMTFSTLRIRGAIMDGLRGEDWVPRLERAKQKRGEVEPRHMATRDFTEVYQNHSSSHNKTFDPPDGRRVEMRERVESLDAIADLCRDLTSMQKRVVRLLYVEKLTMRQAGIELGLSESRISQINSQLAAEIRDRLNGERARERQEIEASAKQAARSWPACEAVLRRRLPRKARSGGERILAKIGRAGKSISFAELERRVNRFVRENGLSTVREIAAELAVSVAEVRRLLREGKLRAVGNLVGAKK